MKSQTRKIVVARGLLVAALTLCTRANAELDKTLYRGTIGSSQVAACVGLNAGELYFADDSKPESTPGTRQRTYVLTKIPQNAVGAAWAFTLAGSSGSLWNPEGFDPGIYSWIAFSSANTQGLQGEVHWVNTDSPDAGSPEMPSRTEPVQLQAAPQSCAVGFEADRLLRPWVIKDNSAIKVGKYVYRRMIHPATYFESLTLLGGIAPASRPKINQALRAIATADNKEWAKCRDFSGAITPVYFSDGLLVFSEYTESYCGGNHPNETSRWHSFNTDSGLPFQLREWLIPLSNPNQYRKFRRLFLTAVERARDTEDDCLERAKQVTLIDASVRISPQAVQVDYGESSRPFNLENAVDHSLGGIKYCETTLF